LQGSHGKSSGMWQFHAGKMPLASIYGTVYA